MEYSFSRMEELQKPRKGALKVIYVSKDQFQQVEYLIGQSIRGNHVLFDLEAVRRVFWNEQSGLPASKISEEDAYSVEYHIERLIVQPSLTEKRAYLDQLDAMTFEKVVKTYFNIVENNIYETLGIRH